MVRWRLVGASVFVCAIFVGQAGAANVHVSGFYVVTVAGEATCVPEDMDAAVVRCETSGRTTTFSGSLTGMSTSSFQQVVDCRHGRISAHGRETFTGSVAGIGSGTLTWGFRSSGTIDCATMTITDVTTRASITEGTDNLRGLRSTLAFGNGVYDGDLH